MLFSVVLSSFSSYGNRVLHEWSGKEDIIDKPGCAVIELLVNVLFGAVPPLGSEAPH